jgi:hydroxymethylpyrimidine pyrophosphatase-like HAD family hydrolase
MSIENNFLEEEIEDMCNDVDYDLMEYEYHNYQPKENTNQINYKMKKVENNKTKKENVETVKETRKDALRRLFKENGLVEEDVYKDKRGFVIITRTGIDKIVSKNNITVAYEVISMDIEKGYCVLKALASMTINGEQRNMMSFGESADNNLMGGGKKFPVAMAEKRAMSRVVLKIAGFYEQGVFGQDEIVD